MAIFYIIYWNHSTSKKKAFGLGALYFLVKQVPLEESNGLLIH